MSCREGIIFQFRDVSFSYPDGTVALEGINLTIHQGEQIALLGVNGSGKSTLLKLLDALVFSTSGELCGFGKPLTEDSMRYEEFAFGFRRRVGFVFQNSEAQLFSSTVREEVLFGPLHLGLSADEAISRADEVIEWLGLSKLRERAPHTLSGGEKKKVALASVLALNPDVLLLDEPTNGLDPRSQRWLIETLQALAQIGKTIIIATHSLDLAAQIAKRAILMEESHRIAADAPIQSALADRAMLLAANLIHERDLDDQKISFPSFPPSES